MMKYIIRNAFFWAKKLGAQDFLVNINIIEWYRCSSTQRTIIEPVLYIEPLVCAHAHALRWRLRGIVVGSAEEY